MAIVARIPMMATTTISSTSEKPFADLIVLKLKLFLKRLIIYALP
jgi:hypothetical protein